MAKLSIVAAAVVDAEVTQGRATRLADAACGGGRIGVCRYGNVFANRTRQIIYANLVVLHVTGPNVVGAVFDALC